MKHSFLIFISVLFFACEKKELPVKQKDRGDITTMQIAMSSENVSDYKNQVWYRLSDNKIISTNLKTDWDIAFDASPNGFHVILNTAKPLVRAYKTNYTQLSQVNDTAGLGINGIPDMPSGNLDSTAFGNWQQNSNVYIIDRGYDGPSRIGFYKIKILSQSSSQYTFEYGDVFGTQTFQGVVIKNNDYNFIAYSFHTNSQINIEPKKAEYDLCFTQYTHVYYNPVIFYQVTGVLSNRTGLRIIKLNNTLFSDIKLSDTLNKTFSANQNVIGHAWKDFDLNNNVYIIYPKQCFIISTADGSFYKLHFIDFLSNSGIRGFPKFEFKKLLE